MSQPIVEKEAGPPAQSDTPVETPDNEKKVREYKDFGHDEAKATRTLSYMTFFALFFGLDLHFHRCPCRHVEGTIYFFSFPGHDMLSSLICLVSCIDRAQGRRPL